MTAAVKTKSYTLNLTGPDVQEATTGLPPHLTEALRNIGMHKVSLVLGSIEADPRAFAKFLGMKSPEMMAFNSRLAGLAGAITLTTNEKETLLALPCALGFDIEGLPATSAIQGDNSASLAAAGISAAALTLPGFDFVDQMPPIRNQGERGTCVAHAVTRCFEQREFVASGKPAPNNLNLSEQFLYWNTKDIDGHLQLEGTWVEFAADSLVNTGVSLEETCPYQPGRYPSPDLAQRGPKPTPKAYTEALQHRADEARRIVASDVDAIKAVIAAGIPVAFAMPVFRSWYNSPETRATGFITLPIGQSDAIVGGHAIALTGWGLDPAVAGGGYFIFDNSWSTAWAPRNQFGAGRGILPFKYVQNYGSEAWAVTLGE